MIVRTILQEYQDQQISLPLELQNTERCHLTTYLSNWHIYRISWNYIAMYVYYECILSGEDLSPHVRVWEVARAGLGARLSDWYDFFNGLHTITW